MNSSHTVDNSIRAAIAVQHSRSVCCLHEHSSSSHEFTSASIHLASWSRWTSKQRWTGGYGTMLRKYGLSVNHVIDARIVNVNGKILNRKTMGEDLFWAIRDDGGGSFGVILSYTVKLVPVSEVNTVFRIMKTVAENATELVYKWQSVLPAIDDDLFLRLLLQPVTVNNSKTGGVAAVVLRRVVVSHGGIELKVMSDGVELVVI
ncbi:hypothetical protein L6452_09944 [Arctium lappa]|uniref:Uncharacterized protein n=1 Tax=Arctium lappa TaxID=4217 RepID=A0ACB9DM03_ARCLA|nr:hypothetical protein L6452_09944 [Arctium lappa]